MGSHSRSVGFAYLVDCHFSEEIVAEAELFFAESHRALVGVVVHSYSRTLR